MADSSLHDLLDRLPEDKLSSVADYMQFLVARCEPPLSEHELRQIAESEAARLRGDRGTPHADVMREFGLDPDAVVTGP